MRPQLKPQAVTVFPAAGRSAPSAGTASLRAAAPAARHTGLKEALPSNSVPLLLRPRYSRFIFGWRSSNTYIFVAFKVCVQSRLMTPDRIAPMRITPETPSMFLAQAAARSVPSGSVRGPR